MPLKTLIDTKDYEGIEKALQNNPGLANEGIPYDEANPVKAHPLHRICDGVCSGTYSDEEAVRMARLFLAHGADVNGRTLVEKKDSPLVAAASLGADEVGILYIDHGANIHHPGCHGGTALHWAAWCGRPKLVKRLLQESPEINKRCIDFTSTPLFWAIHGFISCGKTNREAYQEIATLLMQAGADNRIQNIDGHTVFDLLDDEDHELKRILQGI